MKNNNFLIVISILTLIVAALGATFSFFRIVVKSDDSAVTMEAAQLFINLDVKPLYTDDNLIPLDDGGIIRAFNNNCLDDLGNTACNAYTVNISNFGQNMDYVGTIKFNLSDITHLNYMVLNEDNTIYKDVTNIVNDTELSLGNEFNLLNGENRTFKLIIWLPNLDYVQDDDDGNGNFNASISYSSAAGSKVTGTFGH